MYQNYLFDLYETIIDLQLNESKMEVWEKLTLYYGYYDAIYTKEELQEKYEKTLSKYLKANDKTKYPAIEMEDVFYKLFKIKEIKPKKKYTKSATRIFRMLATESISLYSEVVDVLEALKAQNKNIYLVSNEQSLFGLAELKLLGIEKYFDGCYFASDFGFAMPDPAFYEKVVEESNIKPKKSLLISGSSEILKGCQAMGIDTQLVTNQDGSDLKKILKNN
jgi:putative hydrolase of the HAD superfamily